MFSGHHFSKYDNKTFSQQYAKLLSTDEENLSYITENNLHLYSEIVKRSRKFGTINFVFNGKKRICQMLTLEGYPIILDETDDFCKIIIKTSDLNNLQ